MRERERVSLIDYYRVSIRCKSIVPAKCKKRQNKTLTKNRVIGCQPSLQYHLTHDSTKNEERVCYTCDLSSCI